MSADPTNKHVDVFAAAESSWLAANALAFVIADGTEQLITTRRVVNRWQEVTADERVALFGLIEQLGIHAGSLHFELEAAGRWHIRLQGEGSVFAGLPGFSDGEGQQLLPALRQGLERAQSADFLAAFLQPTGIALLRDDLEDALRRGVHVRILTGDYLNITAPEALRALLELAAEFTTIQAAVYHCEGGRSFHAKAYIFGAGGETAAYVGSSNISRMALTSGVEWNMRALARAQAGELAAIRAGFARLWSAAVPLTAAWIDDYATRPRPSKGWELPPPEPHAIQVEALAALRTAWAAGAKRGLVVLATGLGKTLLAAFAAREMGAQRVLFLAHRDEILKQGRRAFERALPERSSGLFIGPRRDRDVDLLFATVQTLARPEHLESFPCDHFDLVIVDEFHHAAAPSYRRIIDHFTPRFMLGLTATPERSDGAELLALCGSRLIHRAGLIEGIARKRLVPFTYRGIKDEVDYSAIPWKRGNFDPQRLDDVLTRESHAAQALSEYRKHAGASPRRGLWFCASIAHAAFIAAYLTDHGVAAVAVHSGLAGAPRGESLRRLAAGELQAIAAVDVFNEGVDVPDVDVVVLLRPTESRIVFLQQIGRGLRLPERSQKSNLLILDFIGNHDSFLRKPQALMALLGRDVSREAAARMVRERNFELPEGCVVDLDTEVIDLLHALGKEHAADEAIRAFMALRNALGRRPLLREMVAAGNLGRASARWFGSWWELLARLGELEPDEAGVLATRADDLTALESAMPRDAAPWESLLSWVELGGVSEAVPAARLEGGAAALDAMMKLWARALVLRDGTVELGTRATAIDQPVLEDMIKEIAEARVEEARWIAAARTSAAIVLKVSHNSHAPILFLPPASEFMRARTDVWIEGEKYVLKGTATAINVAEAPDGGKNPLPGILRRMFGWRAGASNTRHKVALQKDEAGRWNMSPLYVEPPVALPFYPELAVACGVGDVQHSGADDVRTLMVRTPVSVDPRMDFIVRARGGSMNGGKMPIRDGDHVLCSRLDASALACVEDEACLLVAHDGPDMSEAMIKVPVKDKKSGEWALRSWSGEQVDLPVSRWSGLRVVARVRAVVRPIEPSDI